MAFMRLKMTTKTRLKTKADIAQYAADLEVELAYLERENQDLRSQLNELWSLLEQNTEPEEYTIEPFGSILFEIQNPGLPC